MSLREIETVAKEARDRGEAFAPLRSADGLTLGLGADTAGGRVRFTIEAQVRLLPPDQPVDLEALGRVLEVLRRLGSMGFQLYHYDGGWVTAQREMIEEEIDKAIGRLSDEIFYQAGV